MLAFALFTSFRSELFSDMPELRQKVLLVGRDLCPIYVCLLPVPNLEDVGHACAYSQDMSPATASTEPTGSVFRIQHKHLI